MTVEQVLAAHKEGHGDEKSLKALAAACPEFKDGKCPFAAGYESLKAEASKCPEFKAGCPFGKATEHATAQNVFGSVGMSTEELAKVCPHFAAMAKKPEEKK